VVYGCLDRRTRVELPYERCERFAGCGHYPIRKMALLALDAVTGSSIVPITSGFVPT
jgi:hypothetical protein